MKKVLCILLVHCNWDILDSTSKKGNIWIITIFHQKYNENSLWLYEIFRCYQLHLEWFICYISINVQIMVNVKNLDSLIKLWKVNELQTNQRDNEKWQTVIRKKYETFETVNFNSWSEWYTDVSSSHLCKHIEIICHWIDNWTISSASEYLSSSFQHEFP